MSRVHCLTGCAIGEVAGLAIGTALGLSNTVTIVIAILLAFAFGYGTMIPLLQSGLAMALVLPLALASDTFSIAVIMVAVPGAMDAGLDDALFWGPLAGALGVAFLVAWPVNRWLISRSRGHAVVHEYHHGDGSGLPPTMHPTRLAVIGVTAVALTIGVAVAGAQIAERTGDDQPSHQSD